MTSQNILAVFFASLAFTVGGREFLGAKRTVNSASVKTELNGVLSEVLGYGHGVINSRLAKIHKTMDPLFKALPKNNRGHVSVPVMRYAVRRYFSQNHGWIVKGFNVHEQAMNTSNTTDDTDILKTALPGFIRSILEDRFAHEGFSLDAVVAMVAAVERMAFDEVLRGVELAFHLNSLDRTETLSDDDLTEVLSSYLITEMLEGSEDQEKHRSLKKTINRRYPFWDTTLLFLKDTIGSDIFQRKDVLNPFTEPTTSFEDVVRMAQRASEEFGSWSNHECHEMKDMLLEMDVHNTGRVKLSDFYGYSKDGAWQFLEPSEQLRMAGSLDESSTWLGPQVMIPNYITAMSNCITSAPYYSICCLNECDQVFQQLENRIAAPYASASQIIHVLENGLYVANVSKLNHERLDQIARANGDKKQIPIYGRLFARWLHFVYPQECPYPHEPGVVKLLNQRQWKEMVGEEAESASDDEIAQHVESEFARRAPDPNAGADMWSMDEGLLESSTPSDYVPASSIWTLLRVAAQVGMLAFFLSLLRPIVNMLRSDAKKVVEYEV